MMKLRDLLIAVPHWQTIEIISNDNKLAGQYGDIKTSISAEMSNSSIRDVAACKDCLKIWLSE